MTDTDNQDLNAAIDALHAVKLCRSFYTSSADFVQRRDDIAAILEAPDKNRPRPGIRSAIAKALRDGL